MLHTVRKDNTDTQMENVVLLKTHFDRVKFKHNFPTFCCHSGSFPSLFALIVFSCERTQLYISSSFVQTHLHTCLLFAQYWIHYLLLSVHIVHFVYCVILFHSSLFIAHSVHFFIFIYIMCTLNTVCTIWLNAKLHLFLLVLAVCGDYKLNLIKAFWCKISLIIYYVWKNIWIPMIKHH